MSKVRVNCYALSLDGYGAGAGQEHQWYRPTRTFIETMGGQGGTTGIDDAMARRSFDNVGAWVLGRNMFGPVRGPWADSTWKGWWGDNPPYHVPVFVLTHHERAPLEMEGGTTFHFVTGGIEEALARAKQAAGAKDVRLGGGVETIRQYLRAGLVDQLQLAIASVLLGSGEHLLSGIDLIALGFTVTEQINSEAAMHLVLDRASPAGATE